MSDIKITLLSDEEIWGVDGKGQLDVLNKYGQITAITDLVLLLGGGTIFMYSAKAPDDNTKRGKAGFCYTRSSTDDGKVRCVKEDGSRDWTIKPEHNGIIRPVLLSPSVFSQVYESRVIGYNGTEEVEYGEYPQYAADSDIQGTLEREYRRGRLQKTGKNYTFNEILGGSDSFSRPFHPVKYAEYEYKGKKYIRFQIEGRSTHGFQFCFLSNDMRYSNDDYVWVEVAPIIWLIDAETQTLVSKRGLLSGIRYGDEKKFWYDGDFESTEIYMYLSKYFVRDIIPSVPQKRLPEATEPIVESEIIPETIEEIVERENHEEDEFTRRIEEETTRVIENLRSLLEELKMMNQSENGTQKNTSEILDELVEKHERRPQ